jgi:hypothetical protein
MWKSKELSKRMDKQANAKAAANQQQIASIPMPSAPSQLDTNFDDFPLAKQWVSSLYISVIIVFQLSSDPAIRQQRWIQTFHGQRRQLFDGVL